MCILLPPSNLLLKPLMQPAKDIKEKKSSSPPPKYINGLPQNATQRGLIVCSSGLLRVYFMLSFHLVCVLIIITVIGLINASQEAKIPIPNILSLCQRSLQEGILL